MLSKGTAVIYSSQVYTVEGITEKTIGKTVKEYYCLKKFTMTEIWFLYPLIINSLWAKCAVF